MSLILIILLILILLGGVGGPYVHPAWRPGYGAGWYGNGLIGLLLIVVLILIIVGYLPAWRA
jgi:hypothetical protein